MKGTAAVVGVAILNKLADGTAVDSQLVNVSNAATPTV